MITIGIAVLLSVVFAAFFDNARHWYARFQTYPLLAWIGKAEFRQFDSEYKHRLLNRAAPPTRRSRPACASEQPAASTARGTVVPFLSARVLAT